MFVLFMVAYGIFYVFPNMYAPWQPMRLPLLWIDETIEFIPWTFVIYTSDYLLIALAILLINDSGKFYSFARMMFATLMFCGVFFLFFPTTYPRPIYPDVTNSFVAAAMGLIDIADTPNNCFPSMHVALTAITTWAVRHKGKPVLFFFLVWTLAVIVSTLTTKQHYFVDILGGLSVTFMIASTEWLLFERGFIRRIPVRVKIPGFNRVF